MKPALNKTAQLCFGQYTSFLQPIDWEVVGAGIRDSGYNAGSWHVTSAWDAKQVNWPWLIEKGPAPKADEVSSMTRYQAEIEMEKEQEEQAVTPQVAGPQFDLSKPNPWYTKHIADFLKWVGGENDITIKICLFDGYYQQKWVKYGAAKIHPFRNNKQAIQWAADDLSLPESKPWFTHVSWKTEGNNFDEHVTEYTINPKYKWLWDYIRLWGEQLLIAKAAYPRMDAIEVRYINENHARFNTMGQHTGGFGGEDKLFQIVRMEWEKLGLVHGSGPKADFVIVNDWMPFTGTTFMPEQWAKAGHFDRWPRHKWLREVHGCDIDRINQVKAMAVKYPQWAGLKFTNISTDGFKPEDATYSKRLNALRKTVPLFEAKVPSEAETNNGTPVYHPGDYMKTFQSVLPVMKDIAK